MKGKVSKDKVILTFTLNNEPIFAKREDVESICKQCECYDFCEWENCDCLSKYVNVLDAGGDIF